MSGFADAPPIYSTVINWRICPRSFNAAMAATENRKHPEFFVVATAACDVSAFDDPTGTRAREHLLLTGVTPASEYLADLQAKTG
jgi:hypothetical protein